MSNSSAAFGRRVFLAALLAMGSVCAAQAPDAQSVDPDATPAARTLLHDLDAISGHATIGGQHNYPNTVSEYSDRVFDLTGEFPGIFGQDFGFSSGDDKDSTLGRPSMIAEVIREYRAGAVIALTWHAVRPTDDEPVTFRDSVQGHLSDWEWHQLLTPGTDIYNRWCRQVERIAGYLKELQDAGVPVLFRPYHEMNGNWFWWGGRPGPEGSAALYRQLFERYVHVDHLHNLVWVWNVNSPNGSSAGPVVDYLPGAEYADVLTMDIYEPYRPEFYQSMVALADPIHKPIGLAEVGAMPSLETLAQEPRWAYFMMWSDMAETANTIDQLEAMFHAPNIVNRGDKRISKPAPAPSTPPSPGDSDATVEVRGLLQKLASEEGKGALAGQVVQESSAMVEAQNVKTATGKLPALVELDLAAGTDAKALTAAVRKATDQGELVLLRWSPPRPTDNSSAGTLTDFEWAELLQPGTDLNQRWIAQVDEAAGMLRALADEHLAVLWSPYPEANAIPPPAGFSPPGSAPKIARAWWAGYPGLNGSRELYLRLNDRLTMQYKLHNLAWVWEAAPPSFLPGANNSLEAYFPGALHIDALMLDANALGGRFPLDRMIAEFAGGKPCGVRVAAGIPGAETLARETGWRWITLSPSAAASDAIKAFYADPHVLAAQQQ
jgi:mannan endo-1,4-beta-mannosidase